MAQAAPSKSFSQQHHNCKFKKGGWQQRTKLSVDAGKQSFWLCGSALDVGVPSKWRLYLPHSLEEPLLLLLSKKQSQTLT